MILRKANSSDSWVAWQWRNDPAARLMFRKSDEISWSEHVAWFEAALADPRRLLLIAEDSLGAASIIRFERLDDCSAEVSINVDPGRRGQGIGRHVLKLACRCAFGCWAPHLSRICADIKTDNLPSRSVFTTLGFQCHDTVGGFCRYALSKGDFPEEVKMGFSKEWDDCYRRGGQAIKWPWSDVISLVMRHARPTGSEFRVLELGCGSGANIPFFKSLGCEYFSVEGSEVILRELWEIHPDLKGRIVKGDFTVSLPFEGEFDLIVDRGALTCNTTAAIRKGLENVYAKLKLGGHYVGVDWFSTSHHDYGRGQPEDKFTRSGFQDGTFAHLGPIHFSCREHLLDLFENFEISMLQHKLIRSEIPEDHCELATWNLVAQKRP